MHVSGLDNVLWISGIVGALLLLMILISRQLYKAFPILAILVAWNAICDPLLVMVAYWHNGQFSHYYFQTYYLFEICDYALQLGVLLEIAANVIRPVGQAFTKKLLFGLVGAMLLIGIGAFLFAARVSPSPFTYHRVFLVIDTAIAVLKLLVFLLIAGFSQVLGLSWKNYVLQLATGLAFYSIVGLIAELARNQLHAGPNYYASYQWWGRFEVIGYLCTLSFWCYAFVKKEAPRKEFSPQMAKILVSLSGSTKRQHTVLARSRDQ